MTTTFDLQTVTNAIQGLSITGVVVKDVDQIANKVAEKFGVLAPRPDDFVTNLRVVPSELSEQKLNVYYTLHYIYYHCLIGANTFANYNAMLTKLALIVKAFADDATLSGSINSNAPKFGRIGPVQDAAGNVYHGFEITLDILQFLEV